MAPNTVSLLGSSKPQGEVQAKKEIYYKGYYYDVTDFIRRHPGGQIINFYTEPGEDASIALDQFHFRSKDKVHAIMKSFKRRPASLEEVFQDKKTRTRNQEIDKDFQELFEEVQAEGLFEPSIKEVILRLVEPTGLYLLALGLAAQDMSYYYTGKFMASLAIGFAASRWAYLSHEGGHRSLSGHPRVDQFIQNICHAFFCSGSTVWWNSQHNRHHAMPQRLQHDVDLSALPFVVFNHREVTSKSTVNRFFVKNQALMYFTLDLFLVTLAWKFYTNPRCQLRKRAYFELFLNSFVLVFVWYYGPIVAMLAAYWLAFFLAVNFSLSHTHLDVADQPTHWIEYSLTHSADITHSKFMDYWMGYLNFQVEHHLFPAIPNFRLHLITDRVEALAKKHGLKFQILGYWEATKLTMKNLHHTGHHVADKDDIKSESLFQYVIDQIPFEIPIWKKEAKM